MVGTFDKFEATRYVNAGCFSPQTSVPSISLIEAGQRLGTALYNKGVIGHVTFDMLSFPDPLNQAGPPIFQAIDIHAEYTDYAAICSYFDTLMEGKQDQVKGDYFIEVAEDLELPNPVATNKRHSTMADVNEEMLARANQSKVHTEPRTFMFCNFLHHPGLATI